MQSIEEKRKKAAERMRRWRENPENKAKSDRARTQSRLKDENWERQKQKTKEWKKSNEGKQRTLEYQREYLKKNYQNPEYKERLKRNYKKYLDKKRLNEEYEHFMRNLELQAAEVAA